jgi:hypothetical protein
MLSADAARLAAIEVLSPTAANLSGAGFPTLAGGKVYDSRSIPLQDLDRGEPYTPTLGVYTGDTRTVRRGELASADDYQASAVIEIVAELAVVARDMSPGDPNASGEEYVDALAATDHDARLVLGALCSQVRYLLTQSTAGYFFRDLIMGISQIDEEPFEVPNLGLRWQRTTMRFHCDLRDDSFDPDTGGFPTPVKDLFDRLPAQSYAKAKLTALIAAFPADARPPFEGVNILGNAEGDKIGST